MDKDFNKENNRIIRDEFDGENGKILEERYNKKEIRIKAGIILAAILAVFCISYLITDSITKGKYNKNTSEKKENIVYNNAEALDDNTKIILKEKGKVIKEEELKNFKKNQDITSAVSEQFLVEYFKEQGYSLEELTTDEMVLSKDIEEKNLEPNKYYLGEKDGYLAIYKTDENGKAFIEDENDVYKNNIKVESLPNNLQKELKNFKHVYETKDEAKEIICGYIS